MPIFTVTKLNTFNYNALHTINALLISVTTQLDKKSFCLCMLDKVYFIIDELSS